MAAIVPLADAVADLVEDGHVVALEGFTHLIPYAAGHELIRQGRRELTLVRMTPDLVYDQLIGMGCARKLVFSWGGNPGVGSLHRFRDAVENGWPAPLELEEHTHAGMAARYWAGAAGLPFAVLRGYSGTDLARHTTVAPITCPFTGEGLTAVPALRPDVGIIHAQQADESGNVQLWGISGVQKARDRRRRGRCASPAGSGGRGRRPPGGARGAPTTSRVSKGSRRSRRRGRSAGRMPPNRRGRSQDRPRRRLSVLLGGGLPVVHG